MTLPVGERDAKLLSEFNLRMTTQLHHAHDRVRGLEFRGVHEGRLVELSTVTVGKPTR